MRGLVLETVCQASDDWNRATVSQNLLGSHPGFGAVDNRHHLFRQVRDGTISGLRLERAKSPFCEGEDFSLFGHKIVASDRETPVGLPALSGPKAPAGI